MDDIMDQEMCSDDDDYGDDYYNNADEDFDVEESVSSKNAVDVESAVYDCLDTTRVECLLNECVASVVDGLAVGPDLAKALLNANAWDKDLVSHLMSTSRDATLVACGMLPKAEKPGPATSRFAVAADECSVCSQTDVPMRALACSHAFCVSCWRSHIETRLSEGVSSRIECMQYKCSLICPADFALSCLDKVSLRAKYERYVFQDYVNTHKELRFCVGKDCQMVIRSKEVLAKRVTCNACQAVFCVLCGGNYHAPTNCDTVKKWFTKCADDSETANYISAHTKDCPQCHACIEKNGGCNHMHCAKCKHHFCWMCFGDWKTHGSEYYECSRYRENPEVAAEATNIKVRGSAPGSSSSSSSSSPASSTTASGSTAEKQSQARRALEKYLHYFERWENHNKSLRMEEDMRDRLRKRINDRVSGHEGTWIDWQYLYDAASLLTRSRYTLQYTYPFAYYMEASMRKNLFEHQQGQLEKEVEELAWAIERADGDCKGTLQAHMHRAEQRRLTLLQDFFLRPGDDVTSSAATSSS